MALAKFSANNGQPREPRLLAFVLIALVTLVVFAATAWRPISELALAWFSGQGYSHGPLVVAMCAYLLVSRLRTIRQISADWLAIPVVALCSLMMAIGMMLHVRVVALFFLPLLLLSFVVFVVGRKNATKVVGPIMFLYFAIPVWFPLIEILQFATVQAVSWMIGVAAMPANIVGNFVNLPYGTFEIADGCAGLRYVVVGLALGSFIAMTSPGGTSSRIKTLALAFMLAVIGNWIRVFIIVKIGYDSNMTHELITDHNSLGWVVFAIVMIPLFLVARNKGVVDPSEKAIDITMASSTSRLKMQLLTVAALLSAMVPTSYAAVVAADSRHSEYEFEVEWPDRTDHWRVTDLDGAWKPYFLNADYQVVRRFAAGPILATAYFSGFRYQSQGKEPDYYANRLYPEQAVIQHSEVIASDHGNLMRQTLSDPVNGESIVYFRYFTGDRFALSKVGLKMRTLGEVVRGNYQAGIFGVWIDCNRRCDQAGSLESELVNALPWELK